MRVTNHPSKAAFDRKLKALQEDPEVTLSSMRNPIHGGHAVIGAFDSKGNLVELHRWTDLT